MTIQVTVEIRNVMPTEKIEELSHDVERILLDELGYPDLSVVEIKKEDR